MKNFKQIALGCMLVLAVASLASANIIATYDADTGAPANAAAIVDPLSVAGGTWTQNDASLGGTDVQEGVVDGITNAWRNLDGTDGNNPGYKKAVIAADFTNMYNSGWTYTLNAKLIQGGHFSAWGFSAANAATWGLSTQDRAGASLGISGANMVYGVVGGRNITAGALTDFHELKLVGAAESEHFRTYVNGNYYGTFLLSGGVSNSANDNVIGFQSGSSSGTNREAYLNQISLETNTAGNPTKSTFLDDFQAYTVGTDVDTFGTWTATHTTINGSRIFASGTGGSAMNSIGWISNEVGAYITSEMATAADNTTYSLAVTLAAETSTASNTALFDVRFLVGTDASTATELTSFSGTAIGGSVGKDNAGRHFIFEYTTGDIADGETIYVEIERTGGNSYFYIDDTSMFTTLVPEPATMSLLALGGIAMLKRRKK